MYATCVRIYAVDYGGHCIGRVAGSVKDWSINWTREIKYTKDTRNRVKIRHVQQLCSPAL